MDLDLLREAAVKAEGKWVVPSPPGLAVSVSVRNVGRKHPMSRVSPVISRNAPNVEP